MRPHANSQSFLPKDLPILHFSWLDGLDSKNIFSKFTIIMGRLLAEGLAWSMLFTFPILLIFDNISDIFFKVAVINLGVFMLLLLGLIIISIPVAITAEIASNIIAKFSGWWLIIPQISSVGFRPRIDYYLSIKFIKYNLRHSNIVQILYILLIWGLSAQYHK
jgi:hypothetical protein